MGELQFGLIAIGVLVVAGVILYNRWQEQRYQRDAEAAFGARHEDVLLRAGAPPSPQVLVDSFDFIIPIEASDDVPGASMLEAAGAALERCPRSVHLEGFDEKLAAWELIDPDRGYSRMRAGLQLMDRRGVADPDEVDAFGAAVEKAAASLGMLATMPDPTPALELAKELDRFCGEVDIRIAVHLVNENAP